MLRVSPFEPLSQAYFTVLSPKAVLLVFLARGRGVSEIAYISGATKDFTFEVDGFISWQFLPESLAKKQIRKIFPRFCLVDLVRLLWIREGQTSSIFQ